MLSGTFQALLSGHLPLSFLVAFVPHEHLDHVVIGGESL